MSDLPTTNDTLGRQLRRLGIDGETPNGAQWASLLQRVAETYDEHNNDRELLERSLEISSREMRELFDELQCVSEGQLAFERDRLQAVFDAVDTALLVVDQHGIVNAANPEAARLLGSRARLVGSSLAMLEPPPIQGDACLTRTMSLQSCRLIDGRPTASTSGHTAELRFQVTARSFPLKVAPRTTMPEAQ